MPPAGTRTSRISSRGVGGRGDRVGGEDRAARSSSMSRWWCSSADRDGDARRGPASGVDATSGRHRSQTWTRMLALAVPKIDPTRRERTEVQVVHVVVVGCGRVGSALALEPHRAPATPSPSSTSAGGLRPPRPGLHRPDDRRHRLRPRPAHRGRHRDAPAPLAAVTNGDNSNILIARVARETFGVERVVARIYDPRRAAIYQRLGIPTVATVPWTTERVLRRILPDAPAVEWVDPSAKVCLVERVGARRVGRPAAARARGGRPGAGRGRSAGSASAQIPTPDLVAQEGDVVYLRGGRRRASTSFDDRLAGPVKAGGH